MPEKPIEEVKKELEVIHRILIEVKMDIVYIKDALKKLAETERGMGERARWVVFLNFYF
jgi:uncharacterized membrane protein YjjP (DUF1212 family)